MFGVLPSTLPYIRSGQLRVLGVTTTKRQDVLPGVPGTDEFLPGYEASGWYGIAAPKGTPAEIVDKLNKEINARLADPGTKQRLADLGCLIFGGSPADVAKFVAAKSRGGPRSFTPPASRRSEPRRGAGVALARACTNKIATDIGKC